MRRQHDRSVSCERSPHGFCRRQYAPQELSISLIGRARARLKYQNQLQRSARLVSIPFSSGRARAPNHAGGIRFTRQRFQSPSHRGGRAPVAHEVWHHRCSVVSIPFSSGRARAPSVFIGGGILILLFQSPSHRGGRAPTAVCPMSKATFRSFQSPSHRGGRAPCAHFQATGG